jgi:phosphate transport system protein
MSIRNKFDQGLEELKLKIIKMGSIVEQQIRTSIKCLVTKDVDGAKLIIEADNIVDDLEKQIERDCLLLLLKQQPIASDLRAISAALKMITDMERIGDQAADIAHIATILSEKGEYIKKLVHIPAMADIAIDMVQKCVKAYVNLDINLANQVIKQDDAVDDMFELIKSEFVELIKKDANNGDQAIYFMMIAKYLERIGDHAVNISEWVIFYLTGEHKLTKIL